MAFIWIDALPVNRLLAIKRKSAVTAVINFEANRGAAID